MTAAARIPRQQSFALPTWGGKRRGGGRKSARARAAVPHVVRDEVRASHPVHVSMRAADHVWNLRSERSYRVIDAAVRGAQRRRDFRVVHFSVQGNHLHLIAEADGTKAFERGMRSLSIRIARGLNGMMKRNGRVFADRYHAHVLRTPAEVRNAVAYVLGNFESHAVRRGERTSTKGWVDPFSSSAAKVPRDPQLAMFVAPATAPAATWLLATSHGDALRCGLVASEPLHLPRRRARGASEAVVIASDALNDALLECRSLLKREQSRRLAAESPTCPDLRAALSASPGHSSSYTTSTGLPPESFFRSFSEATMNCEYVASTPSWMVATSARPARSGLGAHSTTFLIPAKTPRTRSPFQVASWTA